MQFQQQHLRVEDSPPENSRGRAQGLDEMVDSGDESDGDHSIIVAEDEGIFIFN